MFRVTWLSSGYGRLALGGAAMSHGQAEAAAKSLRSQGCRDVRVVPALSRTQGDGS